MNGRTQHIIWAFWGGLPLGLGLSRLLYEAAPARFAVLGSPTVAVIFGLLMAGVCGLLLWRDALPTEAMVPFALLWVMIISPPATVNVLRGMVLFAGTFVLSAALTLNKSTDLPTWAAPVVTAMLGGGIYLATLQRTIGRADTFEFQVTAPVLGIAHPTGYPLYTILGGLFSLLPFGEVFTRVNLTSAVAATAALVVLVLLLTRALDVQPSVAVLGALAFGFSPVFWSQAVVAEVYALHTLFAVAILGVALWLHRAPPEIHPYWVMVLAPLCGLSLTNHLTTVLILPAVALAVLFARPRLSAAQWAAAVGIGAAALLLYLYIPLRWPALHDGTPMPLADFIGWVTGSRFSGALQLRAWFTDLGRWEIMARLVATQFGPVGVVLGVGGLVTLALRNWRAAVVTALAFAGVLYYGLNYLVPDVDVFVIPLFWLVAIWAAVAVNAVYEALAERLPAAAPAVIVLFALLPLSLMWQNAPRFDWSDEQALETWGRNVLQLPLAPNAVILADGEKIAPLEYLSRIEGLRDDVDMVVHGIEAEYRETLFTRLAEGRTVYLARYLPGLEGAYSLRAIGPLIEVSPQPIRATPEAITPVERTWQNGITLEGYRFAPQNGILHLTLYWRAPTEPGSAGNVHTLITVRNGSGEAVMHTAPAFPVNDRYPSAAWKPNEIVPDYYALTLPPGTTAEAITVRLTRPFDPQSLPLESGEVALTFDIAPASAQGTLAGQPAALTTPAGAITTINAPATLPQEAEGSITLQWAEGGIQHISLAGGESHPLVEGLELHTVLESGQMLWQLEGDDLRCGWFAMRQEVCVVATTDIAGASTADALANFDDRIILEGIIFPEGAIQPGQPVDVSLRWQAVQPIAQDYTVTVQLIGPDGVLYAQSDSWPVQGTRPTSTWEPGQTITDRHILILAEDAPPGTYEVYVALYTLSTNTRLPVLNADGIAIDNKAAFPGLFVPE